METNDELLKKAHALATELATRHREYRTPGTRAAQPDPWWVLRQAENLAELFLELDGALREGEPLPKDWQENR